MNLFEYAVRNKLRFPYKGMVTVEDLFDLPVKELDKIYKTLKKEIKTETEESLLVEMNEKEVELSNKVEIVKTIVFEKLEEAKKQKERIEKKAAREKLLAIRAEKENEALRNQSLDELDRMIAELED